MNIVYPMNMRIVDPRCRLHELAVGRRVSLAALSRMLDKPDHYFQRFVRMGIPAALEDEDRRFLALFFGVSQMELGGDAPHWAERRAQRVA